MELRTAVAYGMPVILKSCVWALLAVFVSSASLFAGGWYCLEPPLIEKPPTEEQLARHSCIGGSLTKTLVTTSAPLRALTWMRPSAIERTGESSTLQQSASSSGRSSFDRAKVMGKGSSKGLSGRIACSPDSSGRRLALRCVRRSTTGRSLSRFNTSYAAFCFEH